MIQTGYQKEQIVNRIRVDNPWWKSGSIDTYFSNMRPRLYLEKFYTQVADINLLRSVILMGPRRVGKTVLIFHCIERLIKSGVNPRQIIYVSIETPIYNRISLEELFLMACEAQGIEPNEPKKGFYVFFDEIQYLKDWEIHLKSLVDTYRYCKFTVSGSAAAALKMKSGESGAGRFTDFQLPPLTFCEYIQLKGMSNLIVPDKLIVGNIEIPTFKAIDIRELNSQFIHYLNFGGYPEVVFSEKIQSNPGQFIRNDIIDKVLLRDLPSLYGISDVQELNSFFSVIAYHSGNEFSYESLSKMSGVKKDTLRKYIEYLQAAFLIKIVHRTDFNAKRFQRVSSFKIYLTNPSLRCALFQPLELTDDKIGDMVETAVFTQFFPREDATLCYANWKDGRSAGEVDIVKLNNVTQKPLWASEVKWSNRYFDYPAELKSLLKFMDNNKLNTAVVTSIDKQGIREMERVNLFFMPTALYSYIVGYNTINEIYDYTNF
ncbi:MAG: ATP-binding protein [Bacteroidia bacterium]|nr:ATP-binding protein [Bacteroidia bacterium]